MAAVASMKRAGPTESKWDDITRLLQCKLVANSVNTGNCFISTHNGVVRTENELMLRLNSSGCKFRGKTIGDGTFDFNGIAKRNWLTQRWLCAHFRRDATYKFVVISHTDDDAKYFFLKKTKQINQRRKRELPALLDIEYRNPGSLAIISSSTQNGSISITLALLPSTESCCM